MARERARLISFADGYSSIGAVGNPDYLKDFQAQGIEGLKALIAEDKELATILHNAEFTEHYHTINAYSCSVNTLYGDGFALLGNAGEFLDPVFSSGVTAALYSADLAVTALDKELRGERVDWQTEFTDALLVGINVFHQYVDAWYSEDLQNIIFSPHKNTQVTEMIASILAGYAWDESNPFVKDSKYLQRLAVLCTH